MIPIERRFTDQQISLANSINILDYARSRGYPIKKITHNSYKIPGYGGLYIHSNGLKWNRFSENIGVGTIQFVMHMENKTWVEAIKELLNIPESEYSYSSHTYQKPKDIEEERKPFKLPDKNDRFKHVFAYLIGARKIDKQIVYDLVKQKKIYENKYNSCVFVGYNSNGEAKYAAIRGTSTSMQFRKDVAGSDKSYPFTVNVNNGNVCNDKEFTSNNLFVFESPIDMMSYLSLLKLYKINDFQAHCISLGGVCDLALERFLKENQYITNITLGLDNDEAGRFACEQIYQKYADNYSIRRHIPKAKDFNDELVSFWQGECSVQYSSYKTAESQASVCEEEEDDELHYQ